MAFRTAGKLTDTAVRQAKPGEKQRKLYDGNGLYLVVSPAGGKAWRFKFEVAGKRKLPRMADS